MPVYLIHHDSVTAHTTTCGLPADALLIRSEEELAASGLSLPRLTALWNALPGVLSKRFKTRASAVHGLWAGLQKLEPTPPPAEDSTPAISKQAQVIVLLRRKQGATLDEIVAVTGWQKHTVRGAISGALRKRLGLTIESTRTDAGRLYRIVDAG
ncbi:DUF3489 domain-containing protein [Azospirillum sp. Marseille-Q6669]